MAPCSPSTTISLLISGLNNTASYLIRVRGSAARQYVVRVRGSAARPPGASRCSARASLRTPSRPHPPHDGASPGLYFPDSDAINMKGVPTADSTYAGGRRGKERAARHERSNDWRRGGQRPRPRSPPPPAVHAPQLTPTTPLLDT